MAITFTQERKKQRYLMLVLVLVITLILLIVWKGFFQQPQPGPSEVLPVFVPPEIEINLGVLKETQLEEFYPFEPIAPFTGEVGRENPFIPY